MKKLLLAGSALALAATMGPAVTSSVQAAPARNSYCDMAKGQKNLVSWNTYYHCLGPAPQADARIRPAFRSRRNAVYVRSAYGPARPEQTKSPYCNMARGQRNLVSWNAYYHCAGPAQPATETSAPARPTFGEARPVSVYGRQRYAEARPEQVKSPYCDMAKGQRNLVAWNAYYGCLSR